MPDQPPPSKFSLRGLLTLPYRLCNPPPAVGKVRSCGVTPILDVRLEDVLARRHLPPIGLKDLEEFLLYVEHTPENLYFILWLKDYTTRYHAWAQREKSSLVGKKDNLTPNTLHEKFSAPPTPDRSLAMFYLRAKQTFFTPNGDYELNIPSDILAPFHYTHQHDHTHPSLRHSQNIHPDPAVFTEVVMEVQSMLNESLKHFVRAASTNMGSRRAVCGIIAGSIIALLSGVVPLVLTAGRWNIGPHGRLIRLAAFPGLWFGLTALIASLQGVCLLTYFFGDLRQLRKFELARPTISQPISMPRRGQIPPFSIPPCTPETTVGGIPPSVASSDPPTSVGTPRPHPHFSGTSLSETSCESCESEGSSIGCNEIDVSPAFFDDVPAPEGPATASCLHRPEYRSSPSSVVHVESAHVRPSVRSTGLPHSSVADAPPMVYPRQGQRTHLTHVKSSPEYGPTATFIPSDYHNNDAASLVDIARSLRSKQSACYFDFDALPAHKVGLEHCGMSDSASLPLPSSPTVIDPSNSNGLVLSSPSLSGVSPFLGRKQYKCNQRTSPPASSTTGDRQRKSFVWAVLMPSFTAGVPAFAAPMTPVQSPVVKRALWEVVVRAGFVAAIFAGIPTGIVVGLVP